MKNITKDFFLGALTAIVLLGVLYFVNPGNLLSGTGQTHWQTESFMQGLSAGTSRQLTLSNVGALVTSASVTLNGETTLGNCGTATWNPGSLASSSVDGISATSTDIVVTGAALGDSCIGSLDSATSTSAIFSCNISGAATGTITLLNTGSAALDVVTGTAKVCYFD